MNNTEYRASPIRLIKIQYIRALSYTQTSTLRMFSDEGFKCSKFERVKDKAGKRLSHIRFSRCSATQPSEEDSSPAPTLLWASAMEEWCKVSNNCRQCANFSYNFFQKRGKCVFALRQLSQPPTVLIIDCVRSLFLLTVLIIDGGRSLFLLTVLIIDDARSSLRLTVWQIDRS